MKPDTSKLINTMISWYQHVTGFFSPILDSYSYNLSYINSRWFIDLVRLLQKHKVEIKLRKKFIPNIQREYN